MQNIVINRSQLHYNETTGLDKGQYAPIPPHKSRASGYVQGRARYHERPKRCFLFVDADAMSSNVRHARGNEDVPAVYCSTAETK
jgi:hypothetical protein